MAATRLTKAQMQEAVDAVKRFGNQIEAGKYLNLPNGTLLNRLRQAEANGIKASSKIPDKLLTLKQEVKSLTSQLRRAEQDQLSNEYIRKYIFDLAASKPQLPGWLIPKAQKSGLPGIPSTIWSDWHWGEKVSRSEMGGCNSFDMKIAHNRARQLYATIIDLLQNYTVNPKYPGIVVNLGGDMVTGDIHDELTATNDAPIMPVVIDVFGVLAEGLELMANTFGRVFVPCVTGNHGRNTRKIQNKQRHYTSFDWLIYQLLDKHFQNDERITFYIPDGPDAAYKVYNHGYLLTHGDQFRGGDGIIGPLGPIIRGDNKKRSRNSQMGMDYNTMLVGHFHQLMMLPRLIVNGSLKGYDEYAFAGNFPFEPPAQALWLTHPHLGITISMPVYTDREHTGQKVHDWVSVPAK